MVFGLIVGLLGPTIDYPMPSYSDKIEHALSFFILTCWFSGIYKRQAFPWLALALIIFAAATEYLQLALAQGRFGDVQDFMADVAGIGIGLIFALAGLDRWCAWIEARILR